LPGCCPGLDGDAFNARGGRIERFLKFSGFHDQNFDTW